MPTNETKLEILAQAMSEYLTDVKTYGTESQSLDVLKRTFKSNNITIEDWNRLVEFMSNQSDFLQAQVNLQEVFEAIKDCIVDLDNRKVETSVYENGQQAQDTRVNNLEISVSQTYETKLDAQSKLTEAKAYTDDLEETVSETYETKIDADAHKYDKTNPHEVTKTQVGLGNVTNDAQVKRAEMGTANGVATLDSNAKVPTSQLPDSVLGQLHYRGVFNASTGTSGLTKEKGDYYVCQVGGSKNPDGTAHSGEPYAVGDWAVYNGSSWDKVDNTDAVSSVQGRTGVVVITKTDLHIENVDNTSDLDKPVSNATLIELNKKQNQITISAGIPDPDDYEIGDVIGIQTIDEPEMVIGGGLEKVTDLATGIDTLKVKNYEHSAHVIRIDQDRWSVAALHDYFDDGTEIHIIDGVEDKIVTNKNEITARLGSINDWTAELKKNQRFVLDVFNPTIQDTMYFTESDNGFAPTRINVYLRDPYHEKGQPLKLGDILTFDEYPFSNASYSTYVVVRSSIGLGIGNALCLKPICTPLFRHTINLGDETSGILPRVTLIVTNRRSTKFNSVEEFATSVASSPVISVYSSDSGFVTEANYHYVLLGFDKHLINFNLVLFDKYTNEIVIKNSTEFTTISDTVDSI